MNNDYPLVYIKSMLIILATLAFSSKGVGQTAEIDLKLITTL